MPSATRLKLTLLTALLSALVTRAVRAAPLLEISQDGKHFSLLHLVSGHETSFNYYNFSNGSAHATYGSRAGMATTAFFWDIDNNRLSLLLTLGGGKGGSGAANVNISGLPISTRLAISDNPGEYAYRRGSGTFAERVAYQNATSGVVLGRLEASRFTTKIVIQPVVGLTTLQVADGDPALGGILRKLDLTKPVFVSIYPFGGRHGVNSLLENPISPAPLIAHTVNAVHTLNPGDPGDGTPVGVAVPEPVSAAIWGLLIGALILRPRRRTA